MVSHIVKASEVCGVSVKNNADEHLGEINEIVIDKKSGKIIYLVLDFGGILSFGNKFFPVPWRALSYDVNEGCFKLNADKERLKNAPGFDKNNWPEFESDFATTIDKYYN